MKDVIGNELVIGDEVVTMIKDYRELIRAKIIDITDKTILVEYTLNGRTKPSTYRVYSCMLAKI